MTYCDRCGDSVLSCRCAAGVTEYGISIVQIEPRLPEDQIGYHVRNIKKGVLGEPSKIFEEVEEFRDAIEQGVSVMALVELSDLMGAIAAYLAKHHPSMSLDDLQKMRVVTERAFRNGRR